MSNFKKKMNIGKKAENLLFNYLDLAGLEPKFNRDYETKSYYDLEFKLGKKTITAEIKLDWLSCKTGNIAIEYQNEKTKEPSGLYITKADLWGLSIKDQEHWVLFLTSTKALKEYVKTHKGRTIIGAGDGNANLYLYPVEHILRIFKRIDNVDVDKIKGILKELLKDGKL